MKHYIAIYLDWLTMRRWLMRRLQKVSRLCCWIRSGLCDILHESRSMAVHWPHSCNQSRLEMPNRRVLNGSDAAVRVGTIEGAILLD